jgi:predicted DNA-binding transcriptional regulator AlpA
MSDDLESVRVLTRSETIKAVNVSDRTWDRMEARGDTPPKTQISPGRIGYRVVDVKSWLDQRRAEAAA